MAKDNEKTMGQTDQHTAVESNENSVEETELPKEDHTKDTDNTEKRHQLEDPDYRLMLNYLQINSKIRRKAKWQHMDVLSFRKCFENAKEIDHNLTGDELQGLWKVCCGKFKHMTIPDKIDSRSKKSHLEGKGQVCPQNELNAITATQTWNEKLLKWRNDNVIPMTHGELIESSNKTKHDWFSVPEVIEDETLLSYNAREVSSLDNETFFSSFRDLDPRGAGVLKPSEIPKAMSVACEILTTRLNPDSNHFSFDKPVKSSRKRKIASISNLEDSAHGSQGIRQYHRKDEEKSSPT
ncbi:unnamed protein product [Mytilus coruscus]|uniref:Uncharacterized protein n=1 Tax=Mytilus coruscus TaxID=42192 RepID=A0A6J8AYZ3_MYTCO|nr:unnamed protein product [Mytilus coruscus]